MKKVSVLIVFLFITFALISLGVSVSGQFGPEEWTQYRMNSDKNALFNNNSQPLTEKTFKTADEVRATPVVVGNSLFIGNHNSGDLFAFNVKTGEKLWQNKAPNWIHSEMIYQDGKVFVGFGNRFFQDNGIRGTEESGVLALDAESGEIIWKYNTDGEVMPTPALYEGSLYIATGDRNLYKLNPNSGELLHKAEIGSTASMSSPNITEGMLFVGGSGPKPYTFSAYDLTSDEFKWQTEFPDVFAGLDDVPPAVSKNLVVTTALVGNSDNPEHKMYAMNVDTGDIVWEASLGVGEFVKNNKSGAPMIYEGKVFVGSPITKTFYAYDLESGKMIWKFKNEVMKAPPVAQDDIVYFSNTKGYVYALDVETGEKIGEKKLNGKLAPSGPIIINDTMFIGSQDSNVYAFPLSEFSSSGEEDGEVAAAEKTPSKDPKDSNNIGYYVISGLLIIMLVGIALMLKKRKKV
ncbi:outer membrane protein assembly factor BamB family protein [Virgibacillus halodenitrificans]|uniref:outer membrane protein assembly factor BamB family protein n=1 Tax=Virgibacillus halodenitrificans TaxID=1482 RepID=UPI002DBF406B|nr:PQQ-binding-like beta-propeller repeat protein [Virgibacillus halodenitrificans]MEC2158535.1 PQQ-binding-like beta-propeller repeat protein [Virgibacillus halodenitrificans]